MKKTKKLLSTLLAFMLVFTCITSVATVSASAAEEPYCYDIDYYGQIIYENMDKYLARWLNQFFGSECQVGDNAETIVFVDPQLFNYDFLDHICQALSEYFGTTINGGEHLRCNRNYVFGTLQR